MANTQWALKFLVPAAPETSGILVLLVVGGLAVQPSPGFCESETSFLRQLLWVGFTPWQLESHGKNAAMVQRAAEYHGSQSQLQPRLCLLHGQDPKAPIPSNMTLSQTLDLMSTSAKWEIQEFLLHRVFAKIKWRSACKYLGECLASSKC